MSQVTPRITVPNHPAPTRTAWIGALLGLAAVGAVALAIALSGATPQSSSPVSVQAQPGLRADGGPEESGIATAVGSRPASAPSESAVAAAIGTSPAPVGMAPDESRIAAAIATR